MHPHHDDPEVWVAANVVVMQPPMKTPAPLPGMTPISPGAALKVAALQGKIRSGSRLKIHSHLIGTGPTCPNCHCGRKKT